MTKTSNVSLSTYAHLSSLLHYHILLFVVIHV